MNRFIVYTFGFTLGSICTRENNKYYQYYYRFNNKELDNYKKFIEYKNLTKDFDYFISNKNN
jgi:hypothetical protein